MTYSLKEVTNTDWLDKNQRKLKIEAQKKTAEFITKVYGKRCKEFSFSCFICVAWWAYDRLFDELNTAYKITKVKLKL